MPITKLVRLTGQLVGQVEFIGMSNTIPPKPAPIQVAAGAKSVSVQYTGPVLEDKVIGQIPSDSYSPMFIDLSSSESDVVRAQPQMEDGKPVMAEQTANLDLQPYSPVTRGLTRGAIGAIIGGIAGAVVGYFSGNMATFAMSGMAAGGVVGAAWGVKSVEGDTTQAEWQLSPVTKHVLTGHTHFPLAQTTIDGKGNSITTGYHHTYTADVEIQKVGDHKFWEPVVRHSADS